MTVNEKLKRYIEQNIFPQYSLNDKGHQIEHIKYVINR
ncbi:MAG: phosphohydrolase, partial [Bacilli bacterium]|nr:phosphohydrolase [Bacilli bacterium]